MALNKEQVEAEDKGGIGYVYVVTNDSFVKVDSLLPGPKVRPVKIGRAKDYIKRIAIMNSAVYENFTLHMVLHVKDYVRCEDDIHDLFNAYRIRTKDSNGLTEFFRCPLEEIFVRINKYVAKHKDLILAKEDHGIKGIPLLRTSKAQKAVFKQMAEAKARRKLKAQQPAESTRREVFKFSMCGIKAGEMVAFVKDANKQAEVVDDRHVKYEGKKFTLTALAKRLLNTKWSLAGTLYFTYKGAILDDLRKRLE